MTILDVRTTGIDLDAATKERIAGRMVAAFAEVEVGHDDPSAHAGFMVLFDSVADDDMYIGGRRAGVASGTGRGCVVRAQVMAGPWDEDLRKAAVAAVGSVLTDELGLSGTELWMTLTEIPEGSWGYGGRPLSIEAIAPLFSPERQATITAHLAED